MSLRNSRIESKLGIVFGFVCAILSSLFAILMILDVLKILWRDITTCSSVVIGAKLYNTDCMHS